MIIVTFIVYVLVTFGITFGIPIALLSFFALGVSLSESFGDRKWKILNNDKLGFIHLFIYGYFAYVVYFLLFFTMLGCAWFLFFYGIDVLCHKFSIN